MKKIICCIVMLLATSLQADQIVYEVIDDSYQVCNTEPQYRQLLSYSLYGVGKAPQSGCFYAPAGVKAVILQCPESDIILCQFRLEPDQGEPVTVWASKVMLRERE